MTASASLRTRGTDIARADRSRLPVVRLRIRCPDVEEYRRVRAPEFAAQGVQIRGERERPVGARVRLKIELLDGTLAHDGEAEIVGHAGDALRRRMVLKLLEAGAGDAPPRPATAAPPKLADFLFADLDLPDASADGTGPLDKDDELLTPRPTRLPERRPATPAPRLERRSAPVAPRDHVEPTPEPQRLAPAAPPMPGCLATPEDDGTPQFVDPDLVEEIAPDVARQTTTFRQRLKALQRRRHALPIAAAVAVAVAVGGATLAIAAGPTRAEARAADFVAELRCADERMRAGRLSGAGNDSALDHLVAARALVPDDARLAKRVKALSSLFGDLGERALARGDVDEAAAHFQAWLRADPGSEAARQRLREIAERPRTPETGAWPWTGGKPGGSSWVKPPR